MPASVNRLTEILRPNRAKKARYQGYIYIWLSETLAHFIHPPATTPIDSAPCDATPPPLARRATSPARPPPHSLTTVARTTSPPTFSPSTQRRLPPLVVLHLATPLPLLSCLPLDGGIREEATGSTSRRQDLRGGTGIYEEAVGSVRSRPEPRGGLGVIPWERSASWWQRTGPTWLLLQRRWCVQLASLAAYGARLTAPLLPPRAVWICGSAWQGGVTPALGGGADQGRGGPNPR